MQEAQPRSPKRPLSRERANKSGNSIFGDYTQTSNTTTTTTLDDSGSDAAGVFTVNSTDTAASTAEQTGNSISGDYTTTTSTTDSYNVTQTNADPSGNTATWTETGTNTSNGQETGNQAPGTYTHSSNGDDNYTLTEEGTNSAGDFHETINGSDIWNLNETGDTPNQTFSRTISDTGTYSLDDSGAGATISSGDGSYSFTVQENGSWRAGSITQTETGSDRYELLQGFNNIADAGDGSGPGHLGFSPFGTPFIDPPPKNGDDLFREAGIRNGVPKEIIETILQTAKSTICKKPGWAETHNYCEKWAETFSSNLNRALWFKGYKMGLKAATNGGITGPLEKTVWFVPGSIPIFDPDQDHTSMKIQFKDGTIFYIDCTTISAENINNLTRGTSHIGLPGQIPTSWEQYPRKVKPAPPPITWEEAKAIDRKLPGSAYKPGPKW